MVKTSAAKNYIYNTLYKVLSLIMPLITAPYLARVIGKEGTGIFSFTYAIAYNFTLLAKLGLVNYGSRAIARVRDDKTALTKVFSEIYVMQVFTTAIASIMYFSYTICLAKDYKDILLINGIYVLGIAFDIDWLFYGMENFKITSIRNAIVKLITVIAILLLVKKKEDLLIYIIIMAVSDAARFLSIWISLHSCTHFTRVKLKDCFQHLKPNMVLFIPVIATSVYRSMDKIMLGALSTMGETGIYENSEKIVYMLLGFITSLEAVMMPKMSNLIKKGKKEEALSNIDFSMTFVIWLSSAMAFGISGVSARFIPLFYGNEFVGAANILPPLAITLIFIGWANVIRTQYIVPIGKDHLYVWSTIVGAAVNLAVNILLIPRYGAFGAVVGTVAAELSVAIFLSFSVRKSLPIILYSKKNISFIIIGFVMAVMVHFCGRLFSNDYISIAFQIFAGASFYLLTSYLLVKVYNREAYDKIVGKIKITRR